MSYLALQGIRHDIEGLGTLQETRDLVVTDHATADLTGLGLDSLTTGGWVRVTEGTGGRRAQHHHALVVGRGVALQGGVDVVD